jgi:hypothetical protein
MSLRSSLAVLVARPWSSAALALLCVIIGIVAVSGLVPLSPNRQYFPGHQWLIASVSWLLAIFFGYCAAKGLTSRSSSGEE